MSHWYTTESYVQQGSELLLHTSVAAWTWPPIPTRTSMRANVRAPELLICAFGSVQRRAYTQYAVLSTYRAISRLARPYTQPPRTPLGHYGNVERGPTRPKVKTAHTT